MKKLIIIIGAIILIVALLGMYKFNYLASHTGYNADGNKIQKTSEYYDNEGNSAKLAQDIRSVSPTEFKKLAESGNHTIIDIRTAKELLPANGGKIFEEVLNIDFYADNFSQELQKLDPDEKYLIYCRSGSRTSKTLKIMKNLGLKNVADLAGGKISWDKIFE